MDKIKELTSTVVEKSSINSLNNDEVKDSNKDNYRDQDNDNDNETNTDPIASYLEVGHFELINVYTNRYNYIKV